MLSGGFRLKLVLFKVTQSYMTSVSAFSTEHRRLFLQLQERNHYYYFRLLTLLEKVVQSYIHSKGSRERKGGRACPLLCKNKS